MKYRLTILLALIALCAFPALAQDMTTNTVSFNGFSFAFESTLGTNVNITQLAGDAVDVQQPSGPAAPHTEFVLYSDAMPPNTFDASSVVRVYRMADFAGYEMLTTEVQQLQGLLSSRPDLTTYMVGGTGTEGNQLPFVPVQPSVQVIRARAQYVDTASVQGISYVTAYRQDVSPFTSQEFTYTFQGMSADGNYYVSAMFRPATTLFPAEIPADFDGDTFAAGLDDYLNQSIAQINQAAPTDFTPSLATFDGVIQSFSFQPMTPSVPAPGATPTEVVNTDPTFGGLGGVTWTLVSYGSPDAPQAVLPDATVNVVFSDQGVSGNAGCNSYGGGFQYNAGAISFSNVNSTLMACEGAGIMEQETAYLNALNTANSYQIAGTQLQITYDGGVLTFTSAPPGSASELTGTSWTLVSLGSPDSLQPALPEAPISLVFTEQEVGGSAGCNTYGGSFEASNGLIMFSNIVTTLIACEPVTVMDQETMYLNALNSASVYQIINGQLQITYNGGVLVFNRI